MDLAIDITVAAEHLRHLQHGAIDGSGRPAWFSRFSRSSGLGVLPIVVLATCA